MEFAPHFPQSELEHSDTAQALGIDNTCPPEYIEQLKATSWVAERAREILGGVPLRVTSGFRCAALEEAITKTKATTGAHPRACAVDIVPTNMTLAEAAAKLQADAAWMMQVDQLCIEGGCLHIGRPLPRHEVRGDTTINGVRRYPLLGVWAPGKVVGV